MTVKTPEDSSGAAIGTDGGESSNTGYVNVYNMTLTDSYAHYGSVIGSGGNGGNIGKVNVEKSTIDAKGYYNAIIGSGYGGSTAGDIYVVESTVNIGKVNGDLGLIDTGIGSGYSGSVCGDIYVFESNVEIHNSLSACIGAGDEGSTCERIFLASSTIKSQSVHGAGVGSGRNSIVNGDIIISNGTAITHVSGEGAAIGSGLGGHVEKIIITQSSLELLNALRAYSDNTHAYPGIGRGLGGSTGDVSMEAINQSTDGSSGVVVREITTMVAETVIQNIFNPLKIHHGTKANQATNFFINDMHTKSLGSGSLFNLDGSLVNESDEDRYYALSYDKNKQAAWLETLQNAQNKTIDDISVTTKQNANVAIRVLDRAIEYALDESTRIGAYLQRLEYTDSNITIMGENVQSSESIIRDADMAKEMTEYTKANVLSQASQAMLAQANQNLSGVLSLLQ